MGSRLSKNQKTQWDQIGVMLCHTIWWRSRGYLSASSSIYITTITAFAIVALFNLAALPQTVSVSDIVTEPEQVARTVIKVDFVPNGLTGYALHLGLVGNNQAIIKGVEFIAFSGVSSYEIPFDGTSIDFSAYDLENTVQPGSKDVELARVEIYGVISGESTIGLTVKMMDNEYGNPIAPQISTGSVRVTEIGQPTADFSFSPSEPTDLDTIHFMDWSADRNGRLVSWQWSFGDGRASSEKNPLHRYENDGPHRVTLTVTDDDGATDTVSKDITVSNVAPKVNFTFSPREPTDLETVHFEDQSSDKDGTILSREWDFGDGVTSSERNPSHRYANDGMYTVTVRVTDEDRATSEMQKRITILNARPIPKLSFSPPKPGIREVVRFDAGASVDLDGQILSYEWDWNHDGVFETRTASTTINHSFSHCGQHTVMLKVVDDDGDSNTRTCIVGVNCPPTAAFTYSPTNPTAGRLITFDASGSHDPDGSIAEYRWDWDSNAKPQRYALSRQVKHSFHQEGRYRVVLMVTDDNGASATIAKTIEVAASALSNEAPPEDLEAFVEQLLKECYEENPLLALILGFLIIVIGTLMSGY